MLTFLRDMNLRTMRERREGRAHPRMYLSFVRSDKGVPWLQEINFGSGKGVRGDKEIEARDIEQPESEGGSRQTRNGRVSDRGREGKRSEGR